jgi:hypothetical protein
VVGVDAGEAFAFLAEAAAELRPVRWPTSGSQFRSRDLFPDVVARVGVAGRWLDGRVADGAFAVPEGVLAVAAGSSGYRRADGAAVRWVEVFLRGGSAADALGGVRAGDAVELAPLRASS